MKRRADERGSFVALLVALLPLVAASFAVADIVYLYDDLGRLVRVIREDGEAATYRYDPAGNMLRISRESGVPQAATVTTVSTATLPRSGTTTITITGFNLTGAQVTATPGVDVTIVSPLSDVDTLTLEVTVDSTAPLGEAELTIETELGTVTIPITIVAGPPVVAGFAPAKALPGMVVTLTGVDLDSMPQVRINGVTAPVLEALSDRLRIRVPPGATTGPLSVTTNQGTATTATSLVIGSLGPARAGVPTTDLLAYWTLDTQVFPDGGIPTFTSSGPMTEDGADSLDLLLRGTITLSPSVFGQGLDFGIISSTEPSLLPLAARPADDAVLNFGGGDHTYALWARWTSTEGEQVLVEKCPAGDCASEGWGLQKLFDDSLRAAPLLQSPPGAVAAGRWYHIAVVRQGGTARLYLDGALITEVPFAESIAPTSAPLRIGARDPFQPLVMSGMIDEVGIWARALTAAEVSALTRVLGDGGPATSAQLNRPHGVAVDGLGNLFIADTEHHRVRKVSPAGTITTVAGDGTRGFGGDGGPATRAQLDEPHGVAVDPAGNLYIADSDNHRVRMVNSGGTITTVAGTGVPGFDGDAGPAVSAQLNYPIGVAVDGAGELWIADTNNFRVRKVASTGIITTVAGDGTRGFGGDGGPATSAQLENPWGVAVDAAGNLFIADAGVFEPRANDRVRKVSAADGVISTFAGSGEQGFSGDGGPASAAQLNYPAAVATDGAGNVYIADRDNHRIRMVDGTTLTITTIAGNGDPDFGGDGGPATSASLNTPTGVAVSGAGDVFIADRSNQRIRKVSGGVITTVAGSGELPGGEPPGGEGFPPFPE